MFDIGFFELLLIGIVGLIVIGPERLPETIRTVSLWVGRLKRSLRETRSEIEKQIGADDIRRQLHNEEIMHTLAQAKKDVQDSMDPERLLRMNSTEYDDDNNELPDHAHLDESASLDKAQGHYQDAIPDIPVDASPSTSPDKP